VKVCSPFRMRMGGCSVGGGERVLGKGETLHSLAQRDDGGKL
jgi:hypothetical protein